MTQHNRLPIGGRIDRDTPLVFSFNGRRLQGYAGDTVAAALLANGVRTVARSIKYHRPRGIIGSGADEPNAVMQLGDGAATVPNALATQIELYEGLQVRSVGGWPSVERDVFAASGLLSAVLPAGFYYKTFMWPPGFWMHYERLIRKAAGLGRAPTAGDVDRYERVYAHCDVLVVGAGAAGLAAARAAAQAGARVMVVDEQSEFGGSLLRSDDPIGGRPAMDWVAEVVDELGGMGEVRLLRRSTLFGYYDHNLLAVLERVTDHLAHAPAALPRHRLWHVRAHEVVLATGAIERPLVFTDNDTPGVMLASAVSTYLKRYGVAPGRRAVLFTNNDAAYRTAIDLLDAGLAVSAVVDPRPELTGALPERVRARGVDIITGSVVTRAIGRRSLSSVAVERVAPDLSHCLGAAGSLACDLLAVAGGWSPAVHLHAQSGGRPRFDADRVCFVPGAPVQAERSAGACNGTFALGACLREGHRAGIDAAQAAGFNDPAAAPPEVAEHDEQPLQPLWWVPTGAGAGRPKQFVDLQNDTTAADIRLAAREGYRSIEHVKRYTALGFGTDQGKLGNINGMAILARTLGRDLAEIGTTTFRPPYTPVPFAALAGRDLGAERFDPVRQTPMHAWHIAHGAEFENVGQWKRPWFYPRSGETMQDAVNRECRATRAGVGILDASTLGKIDIRGPDAATFLDRIYTNSWSRLEIGRCRYGVMLGEDGMVMDDGVTSRLGPDHFFMTTTTGGAARVFAWMERWLQTEWPELRLYLTSVTDHWAVASIAGPKSRQLIAALCDDIDFSGDAFPFMAVREGTVAGVPARVFRISFSGELGYEINVCADYGRFLWDALMEAGAPHGITAYGTESMHVLRAEKGYVIVGQDTDGSATPVDLGMDWILSQRKDFIGKRSLSRSDCVRENRKQLVGLLTENPADVLPEGAQLVNEPTDERPVPMVGHVTSSYWSACLGRSIALALVKGGRGRVGGAVFAPLMDGRTLRATITSPVFYDPQGERQRV